MSFRFSENDLNTSDGLVQLDSNGKMPVIDGSNLINIDSSPATLTNDFDAYQVVIQSTDATVESGKLYMVTASCTLNFPSGADGDRIGFLIVADGITLTLQISGGSGTTTASRFCYNGTCYSSTYDGGVYNNEFGSTTNATKTFTGKGTCLEFVRYRYPGLYTVWIEKSHQQNFDTGGGTTIGGNWGNFDNVIGTNAATGWNRYNMAYDGVDWRWRILPQDFGTLLTLANGATGSLVLPANHQYMDVLYFLVTCSASGAGFTQAITVNLTNLSALAKDQIHYKPIVILWGGNPLIATNANSKTWPNYIIKFSDTTAGSSISQIYDAAATPNVPYTTYNSFGIKDTAANTFVTQYSGQLGVIITYDKDQAKWYHLRNILKIG